MKILMGPVLSFRGRGSAPTWDLSAVVVTDGEPPTFKAEGTTTAEYPPKLLWETAKLKVYRFEFSAGLQKAPYEFTYTVQDEDYRIAIPGEMSPRMAYASCNGFSALKLMKGVERKNKLWEEMRTAHEKSPYHLLLLGGDQVYADTIWDSVKSLKDWNYMDVERGNERQFSERMSREVEDFYITLYTDRWAQAEVRHMMARVPSISMWDDHDIFDGWGSYPEDRQQCPVFQGIGKWAKKAFSVFQQHLGDGDIHPTAIAPEFGYSFGHVAGKIAILALDMRSERTQAQVLSQAHWNKVYGWLDKLNGLDHLIVLSSIPVVYPGFETLESLLGVLPGYQDLEDDLKDHWDSPPHKGERLRLVHRLFQFAREKKIRPTLVSGDVHVAAVGVLEQHRQQDQEAIVVNQLISSGIVHPGPPAVVLFCLKHLFDSDDEIDRGVIARMTEFPGNRAKFIGKRNFLSLEPDDSRRVWANWIVEGEKYPYTKTIHALGG